MKKLLFITAIATIFGLTTINAQENNSKSGIKKGADAVEKEAVKLYNQAKTGGFKVGGNIGFPMGGTSDISKFNFGFDVAYLFEVMTNLEVGALIGYTHFVGDGIVPYFDKSIIKSPTINDIDNKDAGFIPLSTTARYYFSDRKMFAGIDLGYAFNVSGDADSGLYFRPKFGYNFEKISLIGSYQNISGNINYPGTGVKIPGNSGYGSLNVGIEYGF